MSTLLRTVYCMALVVPLWGQVQPRLEGRETPAEATHGQAGEGRSESLLSEENPFGSPVDFEKGNELFQTHCSHCHGAFGEGGRGADLTIGVYSYGGSDAELFQTIRYGIPGSEMGPPRVETDDLWRIVGFVKKLGTADPEEAPGDPVAGKIEYEKTGCASCHIINGEGGVLGPELTDVGRRRGLTFLEESLVKPEADLLNNYRGIHLITLDGKMIAGIRLNEDGYSIQIRDTSGTPQSFLKHELKEISHDNPSLMPGYGSILSETQLEDLVAYLSSLRGAQ